MGCVRTIQTNCTSQFKKNKLDVWLLLVTEKFKHATAPKRQVDISMVVCELKEWDAKCELASW